MLDSKVSEYVGGELKVNQAYIICGQAGVTPLAYGSFGVGKSATTKAIAEAAGRYFYPMYLGQQIPEDLGGFPVPTTVEYDGTEHRIVKRLMDEGILLCKLQPSVLFLDELTCATPAVQAAALQWGLEDVPNCWKFAAANPSNIATNGSPLEPAMINRMCVMEWEPDIESWAEGMTNGNASEFPVPYMPILPADWEEGVGHYAAQAVKFVTDTNHVLARPELLNKTPSDDASELPFPTQRSWTNAVRLLGAADSVGADEHTRRTLVVGCLGDDAGQMFLDFMKHEEYKTPEEILADPYDVRVPKSCHLAICYIGSVLRRVREDLTPTRWENLRIFLASCHKQNPDVAQAFKGKAWKIKPVGHQPEYNQYFADMESERSDLPI